MMKIFKLVILFALSSVVSGVTFSVAAGVPIGTFFSAEIEFDTTELAVADQTLIKCASVGSKAGWLGAVACHRYAGDGASVDIWVLESKDSVFPAATGTSQAYQLTYAPAIVGRETIPVGHSFTSKTAPPIYNSLCIQAKTNGGSSGVKCELRGYTGKALGF